MPSILSYSLSVAIMLAILYPIYKVALSKEGFPAYNRGIILAIYLISLTYMPICQKLLTPQGSVDLSIKETQQLPIIDSQPAVNIFLTSETAVPDDGIMQAKSDKPISNSVFTILLWLYSAGLVAMLIHMAFTWIKVYTLIRSGVIHKYHGYKLVIINYRRIAPFSWMNYLVISEDDLEHDGEMIVLHEMEHINCHHWADVIIAQLVIALNWYNPVAWMLHKELRAVHEYQADNAVIRQGVDAANYQMLLIKKASLTSYSSAVNSFNQSKLKDRLNMMWNRDINPRRKWRATIMIPALAIGIIMANGSIMSEARTSLSASQWDFEEDEPPGPEKVRRVFAMETVRRDSAIVVLSNGNRQSVKIENRSTAATNEMPKRTNGKKSTTTTTVPTTSTGRTQINIPDWPNGGILLPTGNDVDYFVDGKHVSYSECKEAIENGPRRIMIDNNLVEVQTSEDEYQRLLYDQIEQARIQQEHARQQREQARLQREQAQRQREEAQIQAQIAREEAQRQAQIAREEAQRQAQIAREQAQRQREEAQRQAQIAREQAQRQREKARKERERLRRNGNSYSSSRSVSDGKEIVVIDNNGNVTVKNSGSKTKNRRTANSRIKKQMDAIKKMDRNAFDGINKSDITSISIHGEMPNCTVNIVAESESATISRTITYVNRKPTTTTTITNM